MKLGINPIAMIRVCAGISHCKLQRMLAMLLRQGRSEVGHQDGGLAQGSQCFYRRGGTELPPPQGKA